MIIEIDATSSVPPYEQLRQRITTLVLSGQLPEEFRLPTIRQLAGDLGLAPGTVARAYRELEVDGIVTGRGRQGTFTRLPDESPTPADIDPRLVAAARAFADEARRLRVDDSAAMQQVRRALDDVAPAPTDEPATATPRSNVGRSHRATVLRPAT